MKLNYLPKSRLGYHYVLVDPQDVWKEMFKNKEGLYVVIGGAIGLTNGPMIFMCLMNDILHPFTYKFIVVYLNGVLIYNKTWGKNYTLGTSPQSLRPYSTTRFMRIQCNNAH
jgi:hypothetical protein